MLKFIKFTKAKNHLTHHLNKLYFYESKKPIKHEMQKSYRRKQENLSKTRKSKNLFISASFLTSLAG